MTWLDDVAHAEKAADGEITSEKLPWFRLIRQGLAGPAEAVVAKAPTEEALHDVTNVPVPAWPLVQTGAEARATLREQHLVPRPWLPATVLAEGWRSWMQTPATRDPLDNLYADMGPPVTEVTVPRRLADGELEWDKLEERAVLSAFKTASTSMSLQRAPAALSSDAVRGRSENLPFMPGGLQVAEEFSRETDADSELLAGLGGVLLEEPEAWATADQAASDPQPAPAANAPPSSLFGALLQQVDAVEASWKERQASDKAPEAAPQSDAEESEDAAAQEPETQWAVLVDPNDKMEQFDRLVPAPARTYPFELDAFQKQAVFQLEQQQSVFVAAHTSAGKTVVAEYAIALALKHKTRVVYTSPIKALSNQKFRDFRRVFGEDKVGILTGDVQVAPEAPCMVMTTEILRSMLYRGADVIRDTEFVIFDEVHYVNDQERGVVWEEVIILLPDHVQLVLLSATVPNALEFAQWIGQTKRKQIHVVSTAFRPVPLEHFVYVDRELFRVVDRHREFDVAGYRRALSRAGQVSGPSKVKSHHGHDKSDRTRYVALADVLRKQALLPAIIFVLSKRRCDEYADALRNVDFTAGASDKSEIHVFFERAMARLSGTDAQLPQIQRVREMLMRGVAVHHGGLLPILKEVVEILFARGQVRLLLATETFAMGVNAPARSVVFANTRKHDGTQFRDLSPGEYTQMSGRAGRRGLDDRGVCILLPPTSRGSGSGSGGGSIPDAASLQPLILGRPARLQSQFRLTYTMVLNLLRVETLHVEEMIRRSFSEAATQAQAPERARELQALDAALPGLRDAETPEARALFTWTALMEDAQRRVTRAALAHAAFRRLLVGPPAGRIVVLSVAGLWSVWATVLGSAGPAQLRVAVFARVLPEDTRRPWGQTSGPGSVIEVATVPISAVLLVTDRSVPLLDVPSDAAALEERVRETLAPLATAGFSPRDCLAAQNASGRAAVGLELHDALRLRDGVLEKKPKGAENISAAEFARAGARADAEARRAALVRELAGANLALVPEYEAMLAVLCELGYIQPVSAAQRRHGTLAAGPAAPFTMTLKGRVACEVNTVDALLLCELLLDGFFAAFDAAESVALLSALVFQDASAPADEDLPPQLADGLADMQARALSLFETQQAFGVAQAAAGVGDMDAAQALVRPGLVRIVYEWARGVPFRDIMALTTTVVEGAIVRTIVRLVETCREARDAARVLGNPGLYRSMDEAMDLIKRDIVFAASLYL